MTEGTNEAAVEGTEETVGKEPLLKIKKDNYVSQRAASGSKSQSNGDEVAIALTGLTLEAIHVVGDSILGEDTAAVYAHLNPGMQRMTVGNRVRGWVNKQESRPAALEILEDDVKIAVAQYPAPAPAKPAPTASEGEAS